MDSKLAQCPDWLVHHFTEAGGGLSFCKYMNLALNDPANGAYSTGKINIGIKGDFVTSPSLTPDFGELLSFQLIEWLDQLMASTKFSEKLVVIDIGPGEGDLTFDLIAALQKFSPSMLRRIQFILVEINEGMKLRQKKKLEQFPSSLIRWASLEELSRTSQVGVIIAHEILDALPVERVVYKNNKLYQQGVKLIEDSGNYFLDYFDLPLPNKLNHFIRDLSDYCKVNIPPDKAAEGWSTELHTNLNSWFEKISKSLDYGLVLVIDYALEAKRYYHVNRDLGSIVSYKNQCCTFNVLKDAGLCDITSHLCIESMQIYASKHNLFSKGIVRQGQALLALGLADILSSLAQADNVDLPTVLRRREALLRLVDPIALGDLRWQVFELNKNRNVYNFDIKSRLLYEP